MIFQQISVRISQMQSFGQFSTTTDENQKVIVILLIQ